MFRKFSSWIIAILKKYAVPTLKSLGNAIGREALKSVSSIAKDVISGVDAQGSLKNSFSTSVENLNEKAEKTLESWAIKRKKNFKNVIILKKQKKKSYPNLKIYLHKKNDENWAVSRSFKI